MLDPSWYWQTQSSLPKSSNHSHMLWTYLKCNSRDLRKRKGLKNNIFSFHGVFLIFLADCNLPECVWSSSVGLDLLRLGGRLLPHCPAVCSSFKESSAQLHLTEKRREYSSSFKWYKKLRANYLLLIILEISRFALQENPRHSKAIDIFLNAKISSKPNSLISIGKKCSSADWLPIYDYASDYNSAIHREERVWNYLIHTLWRLIQ